MLKKILLAAFIAATASFAQIDFGARVGANVNTIRGDDSENFGSGIGFNAGAAVKISLPLLPITLAPEVLIDMRNFTYERNNKLSSTTWALDIPVMVRFSLLPILFIEGGPQFTFNLSTTSEEDLVVDTRLIKVNDGTIDDWYEFGTFELNLAFGDVNPKS